MLWLSSAASAHLLYSFLSRTKRMRLHSFFVNTRRATCPLVDRQPDTADTCYVLRMRWSHSAGVHRLPSKETKLSKKTCQIMRKKFVSIFGRGPLAYRFVSITELFSGFHFRFVSCLRQLRTGAAGNFPQDICHQQDSRCYLGQTWSHPALSLSATP